MVTQYLLFIYSIVGALKRRLTPLRRRNELAKKLQIAIAGMDTV
jgi:hypothetical protein